MFMMMATTSTAMGVLVLNIHHQDVVTKVPYWIRYVSVRILAPLLFATDLAEPLRLELSLCSLLSSPMKKKRLCVDEYEMSSRTTLNTVYSDIHDMGVGVKTHFAPKCQSSVKAGKANGHFSYSDHHNKAQTTTAGLSFLQRQRSLNDFDLITLSRSSSQHELNALADEHHTDAMLALILQEVRRMNTKRDQALRRKHLLCEWKIVAQLIDRLLMVVFVLINSIGTSCCLLLAARG